MKSKNATSTWHCGCWLPFLAFWCPFSLRNYGNPSFIAASVAVVSWRLLAVERRSSHVVYGAASRQQQQPMRPGLHRLTAINDVMSPLSLRRPTASRLRRILSLYARRIGLESGRTTRPRYHQPQQQSDVTTKQYIPTSLRFNFSHLWLLYD